MTLSHDMISRPMRLVFTSDTPSCIRESGETVYAVIGPLATFTSDPDFQDELQLLCAKYNLAHGHLSQTKFRKIKAGKL